MKHVEGFPRSDWWDNKSHRFPVNPGRVGVELRLSAGDKIEKIPFFSKRYSQRAVE